MFTFGILWDECFTAVCRLSDLILGLFVGSCVDGLKVVFTYKVLYFRVVLLHRKIDYRLSFISFYIHSFIVFEFCFYLL